MMSKNDTSSVKAMVTVVALSAMSLTTTLNTSGMIYNDSSFTIIDNFSENDIGTTTPAPQISEAKAQTSYNFAKELFESDMRDFTKEETEIYKASLKKMYKPTGVNIFDIC